MAGVAEPIGRYNSLADVVAVLVEQLPDNVVTDKADAVAWLESYRAEQDDDAHAAGEQAEYDRAGEDRLPVGDEKLPAGDDDDTADDDDQDDDTADEFEDSDNPAGAGRFASV